MAVSLSLSGCLQEEGPLAPARDLVPEAVQAAHLCRAEVRSGNISCTPESPTLPAGVSGAVLGGQGTYVLLESSNVQYDAVSEIFSADVTIRNLLTQTLGTADGESVHAEGVQVFFIEPPVATGGAVTLRNADGEATFTGPTQPYFQYDQALGPGRVSLPRTWQWNVPAGVQTFTFKVYVSAKAAAEESLEAGLRIDASTISAGVDHTCGLTLAGAAYCWGGGQYGQRGDGTTTYYQVTPTAVLGGKIFVSISVGAFHSCGLTLAGAAYCWGAPWYGQLGDGTTTDYQVTPTAVLGGKIFVSISAGHVHTCGITADGAAYCWGSGDSGQLGDGTTTAQQTTPTPVEPPEGKPFVSISAGQSHTCGITADGAAYCWGYGDYGQLGDGSVTTKQTTPSPVLPPEGKPFVAISAGQSHTCGITADGAAYCWGYGYFGQLGDGTETELQKTPSPVLGGKTFVAISAGNSHTCGITADGAAYCWGSAWDGQLGDGTSEHSNTPTLVLGGKIFVSISAGESHTCGITADGAAYCWGAGWDGQLGDGTAENRDMPTPVSTVTNFALLDPRPAGAMPTLRLPRTPFEAYAFAGRTGPAQACTLRHA